MTYGRYEASGRVPVHPLLERARKVRSGSGSVPSLLGLFLLWAEAGIAELCGRLPVDFVVIDMEAGALGRPDVLRMVQALSASPISVLVRVPSHEPHVIEHALDIGAHGVMVPKVNTPEQAVAVSAVTRFPPDGCRGVNPVRASGYFGDLPGYFKHANDTVLCIVQVETGGAADRADAIAAVPGVDGLFWAWAIWRWRSGSPAMSRA